MFVHYCLFFDVRFVRSKPTIIRNTVFVPVAMITTLSINLSSIPIYIFIYMHWTSIYLSSIYWSIYLYMHKHIYLSFIPLNKYLSSYLYTYILHINSISIYILYHCINIYLIIYIPIYMHICIAYLQYLQNLIYIFIKIHCTSIYLSSINWSIYLYMHKQSICLLYHWINIYLLIYIHIYVYMYIYLQ